MSCRSVKRLGAKMLSLQRDTVVHVALLSAPPFFIPICTYKDSMDPLEPQIMHTCLAWRMRPYQLYTNAINWLLWIDLNAVYADSLITSKVIRIGFSLISTFSINSLICAIPQWDSNWILYCEWKSYWQVTKLLQLYFDVHFECNSSYCDCHSGQWCVRWNSTVAFIFRTKSIFMGMWLSSSWGLW